jgi:hypothetical protein
MNSFINYQNRSVELPEGCKDLTDVLNLAKAASASAPEGTQTGSLGVPGCPAEVGTYLLRFSTSTAKVRSLWIHIRWDAPSLVAVFCGKHGLRGLIFVDAGREQFVRTVLADFGISPFQDDLLPNNVRGLQCQLSSVSDPGHFLAQLLTNGFSVTQDTVLEFDYRERNAA